MNMAHGRHLRLPSDGGLRGRRGDLLLWEEQAGEDVRHESGGPCGHGAREAEEDAEGDVPPDRAQRLQPRATVGAHSGSEQGLGRPQGLPEGQPVRPGRAPACHQG